MVDAWKSSISQTFVSQVVQNLVPILSNYNTIY